MSSDDFNAEVSGGMNNAELVNKDSFERLRSKNRRKEFHRRIFYLLISLILIAAVGLICVVFFFGMEDIEVRGNSRYTEDEIISACGFGEKENLFTIDFDEVEDSISEKYPYIRGVSFKRVLPSTLIITVTEDAPVWYTEICGDWFILSSDLRVISRHKIKEEIEVLDPELKYLALPDAEYAMTGDLVEFIKASNYDYTVSFLEELSGYEVFSSIGSIDASDRYHITIYSSDGKYKIKLGTSENLEAKLRFVLKVIEEAFNKNTIASIDVEKLSSVVVLKQDEPFSYP